MNSGPTPLPDVLSRGGRLVLTSEGPVQYGVPPETIKDTLGTAYGVPKVFILPKIMFGMEAGISLAELEFPIYYNFFFKRRKIRVICTPSQRKRLETILGEALFGPDHLEYEMEFVDGAATPGFPDLAAEMRNFRTMPVQGETRPLELEDVVAFSELSSSAPVRLGGLSVLLARDGTVVLEENGRETARFAPDMRLITEGGGVREPVPVFHPPLFGITTLGAGHGFAPDAMTSGMIIWVNRRGILVDPPVNSGPELARLGVPPRILDSIILTHCHADHDAGTLQKIMQEGRITLYTTPTIFRSFIRKSAALTDIPGALLENAIRFVPLTIGAPVNINGGLFRFNYSLHAIPTISIQAAFGGKTMVYSSDTHNDPAYVDELFDRGVVSRSRRDFLKDFPWNRDVIFHEAGIPPLHTPMSVLTGLPEAVRNRMYLVHVTRDMIPEGSGLTIAPTGLAATVELDVSPPASGQAVELLATYLDQPLFRELPPEKTLEFLCIARTRDYREGEIVIQQGDPGEEIFFVMTGQVEVVEDGASLTTFGRGDFFGEKCLFGNQPRTATVVARNDARLIRVPKREMLAFIRNTYVEQALFNLSAVQNRVLRRRLALNPIFRSLTPSQKTAFFQILVPAAGQGPDGAPVIAEGEPSDACYFIAKGEVSVTRNGTETTRLRPGGLFGAWMIFNETALSPHTFTADPDALLYRMDRRDLSLFAQTNPGVYLKLYAHEHDSL